MPIKLPKDIPAFRVLEEKNVFVIDVDKAERQDIRALKIGILNLMPEKQLTETQLFRMIGNSPLQIEPVLIKTISYTPQNVSESHLEKFYLTFEQVMKDGLDGLIITGAPVEQFPFEEVKYWEELKEIMAWSRKYVSSVLFLCWGAMAGLYYHYGIAKYPTPKKVFGIFKQTHSGKCRFLLRGMDDEFYAPHSYHAMARKQDVEEHEELEILAESEEDRIYIAADKDRGSVFVFGHPEYDRERLAYEYFRDRDKGADIQIPKNCFPNNDVSATPKLIWRANAETFYRNWINFVYQTTNYDVTKYRFGQDVRA